MQPTILTAAGRYFDFLAPERSVIGIDEIAHALSNICRFTGHTRDFYSVAEHSVHVSRLVPPGDALAGLMHDAAEAFVGDVAKPLKRLLPDYAAIEARVEAAVLSRFGLNVTLPPTVTAADDDMSVVEQRQAMDAEAYDRVLPSFHNPQAKLVRLEFWEPAEARMMFLQRFEEVTL